MTQVGVAKLKASLSEYLTKVKDGESVLVTEHGRPVARLVPIELPVDDDMAYLKELERQGLVRINGTGRVSDEYWSLVLPEDPEGLALKYLLEERESGW